MNEVLREGESGERYCGYVSGIHDNMKRCRTWPELGFMRKKAVSAMQLKIRRQS